MLKKGLLIIGMIISLPTFAGLSSLDVVKSVVNSKAVKELSLDAAAEGYTDFAKVEKTATYRCPGCFDYSLTFRQMTMGGHVDLVKKVSTRMVNFASGEIEVTAK
ncbi:MAG: hypothetical protein A2X86_09320 [Bdellovibrionales bacterium GWA2_49_15]|nr:MAG: hypothetical protein A2X86_09320 [Bdellovibrionales bacterium GWA2_49_15]HAZ12978.1 hypothetical protein [Bdellovibrionales bacterium]